MDVMRRAEAGRRAQQMSESDESVVNTPLRVAAAFVIVVLTSLLGLWFFEVVEVPESWVAGSSTSTYTGVATEDGVSLVSKVDGERILIYDGANWYDSDFVVGFNVGSSLPGYTADEHAPSKNDYKRWFAVARDMDVALLRVKGQMSPTFYEALDEYNADLSVPMWVVHGIAIPASMDTAEALAAVESTVHAVHGSGSGGFAVDVSHYVLGWVVGDGTWDPVAVRAKGVTASYEGDYFVSTEAASGFEAWLAELMDHTARVDMGYDWQHPVSFGCSQRLDPLQHASEGNSTYDDWVDVDATRIVTSDLFVAGAFASFSAYPYAPAFMRHEYNSFRKPNGASISDPFGAYLWELREHFDGVMPVVITEMGMPAAVGSGASGPLGRSAGNLTEFEAAGHLTDMIHIANDYDYQAVLIQSLVHDWGAGTDNVDPLDVADRRHLWLNALSAHQQFGLVAVEPVPSVVLDGNADEWTVASGLRYAPTVLETGSFEMRITHDEAFMYVLLTKAEGVEWALGHDELWIGLDTVDGSGSDTADVSPVAFERGVEAVLEVSNQGARVYANQGLSYYHRHWEPQIAFDYETLAAGGGEADADQAYSGSADGEFALWRLVTDMPTYRPDTEQVQRAAFVDVGALLSGKTDHDESSTYENRALWYMEKDTIEVRLPWAMLGFNDPSESSAWRFGSSSWPDLEVGHYPVDGANTTAFRGVQLEPIMLQGGEVVSRPGATHYEWENWDAVCFCERLSMGAEILLTATNLYSIIGASGRRRLAVDFDNPPSPFSYCGCGADAEPDDGFALSLLFVLVGTSLFILLSFYLWAKLGQDPIHDIEPAGTPPLLWRPFRPLWFLTRHPKLRRRLRFLLYYSVVALVLVATNFYLFKAAEEFALSVLDQLNYAFLLTINVEILTIGVAVVLCEWPAEPKPYPSGYPPEYHAHIKRVALLITCHNSADRIRETLAAALGTFEPHQIFVCDNGRSMHPSDDTREETIDVSDEYHIRFREDQGLPYLPINYIWIPEGSKVVATRHVVHHYVDPKHFDYVMTIDDDVLVAPHLFVPFKHFKDPRVMALAFTLAAENNKLPDGTTPPLNTLQRLQDCEYKLAGFAKIFQTFFGSALFAHGAVGFWKRDAFAAVLERHDTMHMGDDLQLGLILHGMDDPIELDGLRGGYVVHAAGEVSVSTQVPSCFYHRGDLRKYAKSIVTGLLGFVAGNAMKNWAASARECKTLHPSHIPTSKLREELRQLGLPWNGPRYKLVQMLCKVNEAESENTPCSVSGCGRFAVSGTAECGDHGGYGCGEPSLFAQRVMGWDCTEQRFFQKFVQIICKGVVACNAHSYFVVLMCVGQLYIILMDWLRLPVTVLLLVGPARNSFVGGLIISWAVQVVVLTAFNELVLKRRHGNAPLGVKRHTIMLLPIYKFWNAVVFRSLATLYNATYYLLVEENKMQIMTRATYRCHNPFSHEHRCMRTEKTKTKSIIVERHMDKQYQPPFFYFCPNGHLPPGPKTVGTPEEKRAYTDILKQYEVLAEFDDDNLQMKEVQHQIADLQEQLQRVMAELERARHAEPPPAAVHHHHAAPPADVDGAAALLREQLAADQARFVAQQAAEQQRQHVLMMQKLEERTTTTTTHAAEAAAAAASAAAASREQWLEERAARADSQISSLTDAVSKLNPTNQAMDSLKAQLAQIREARRKLDSTDRVSGPPSASKPMPKARYVAPVPGANNGGRVVGPPRGGAKTPTRAAASAAANNRAGKAITTALAATGRRASTVAPGASPASTIRPPPITAPPPASQADLPGGAATPQHGGEEEAKEEAKAPERVAGPPSQFHRTPRGRIRQMAARKAKKKKAEDRYRADGPPL